MSIVIEYVIDWKTIIQDKEIFSESNISFLNFEKEFTFANFLDSFANVKILISDLNNNNIYFNCSLLSFTYNFYIGLVALKNNINKVSYCFGSEQNDFFLKYYIIKNDLIIENNGKKYTYNLISFFDKIELLIDKVIFELPLFYENLLGSKYFIDFKEKIKSPRLSEEF